jgi:hypothetical protein
MQRPSSTELLERISKLTITQKQPVIEDFLFAQEVKQHFWCLSLEPEVNICSIIGSASTSVITTVQEFDCFWATVNRSIVDFVVLSDETRYVIWILINS